MSPPPPGQTACAAPKYFDPLQLAMFTGAAAVFGDLAVPVDLDPCCPFRDPTAGAVFPCAAGEALVRSCAPRVIQASAVAIRWKVFRTGRRLGGPASGRRTSEAAIDTDLPRRGPSHRPRGRCPCASNMIKLRPGDADRFPTPTSDGLVLHLGPAASDRFRDRSLADNHSTRFFLLFVAFVNICMFNGASRRPSSLPCASPSGHGMERQRT